MDSGKNKTLDMHKAYLPLFAFIIITFTSCKKGKKDESTPPPSTLEVLDVRYSVNGTMTEYASNQFQGLYPHEIILEKVGSNQGRMVPDAQL